MSRQFGGQRRGGGKGGGHGGNHHQGNYSGPYHGGQGGGRRNDYESNSALAQLMAGARRLAGQAQERALEQQFMQAVTGQGMLGGQTFGGGPFAAMASLAFPGVAHAPASTHAAAFPFATAGGGAFGMQNTAIPGQHQVLTQLLSQPHILANAGNINTILNTLAPHVTPSQLEAIRGVLNGGQNRSSNSLADGLLAVLGGHQGQTLSPEAQNTLSRVELALRGESAPSSTPVQSAGATSAAAPAATTAPPPTTEANTSGQAEQAVASTVSVLGGLVARMESLASSLFAQQPCGNVGSGCGGCPSRSGSGASNLMVPPSRAFQPGQLTGTLDAGGAAPLTPQGLSSPSEDLQVPSIITHVKWPTHTTQRAAILITDMELDFKTHINFLSVAGIGQERPQAKIPGLSKENPEETVPFMEWLNSIVHAKSLAQWVRKLELLKLSPTWTDCSILTPDDLPHVVKSKALVLILWLHLDVEGKNFNTEAEQSAQRWLGAHA
eukprot:TRINITY_DN21415_c0_g1_i1.p2 TRINITY_DN21415_c0_g1~~TRINITY_DN21415_c0_g1_i1.p2  ORF type:complete len:521 (-),score=58.03 TRINITY_DN21415_c0_g1_i1:5275-6759(-)